MKRKQFLSSILPFGALLTGMNNASGIQTFSGPSKIPPYLKKGDMIGIACPSGYLSAEEVTPAVNQLKAWGFQVKTGESVGKKDFTFGGTDEERRKDFQQMLDDPQVKAILCGRGGYGAIRIIDQLEFRRFVQSPKWILGFSDATVFHSHIHQRLGIATIHSKMCNSFPEKISEAEQSQIDSIESIRKCLMGEKMKYEFAAYNGNRYGVARGQLVGGNLAIIEALASSNSDCNTAGKILFLEDTGEYKYNIDRMLWNLKRSGKLSKLAGLIIGGFKARPDDPGEEFGISITDMILEKVSEYQYPVCFNFPVGHQKNNLALKCGVNHQLSVHSNQCLLTEL